MSTYIDQVKIGRYIAAKGKGLGDVEYAVIVTAEFHPEEL
jgi:hypothetical protein